MKTTKIILSVVGGIICLALATVLVWGLLYLAVPNVKTWTDEHIFTKNEVVEETPPDVELHAKFNILEYNIEV